MTTKPKLTKAQELLLRAVQSGPQIEAEGYRPAHALCKMGLVKLQKIGAEWENRMRITITELGRAAVKRAEG